METALPVLTNQPVSRKQHCSIFTDMGLSKNYIAGFSQNSASEENYIAFQEAFLHRNGLQP